MNDYVLGGAVGGLSAFAFAIPAIIFELTEGGHVKNIPLLVDVKTFWGMKLTPFATFLAGLLLHLILGFLFGAIYPVFVVKGWLVFTNAPYTLLSLVIYAFGAWMIAGGVVFPLLGFGWFGRKQGKRVWLELLASMLLIGVAMWFVVQYYQPFFFNAPR